MPERITPDSPVEQLRTMTARGIVVRFFFRHMLHVELQKDEAARLVRVEIWWLEGTPDEARAETVAGLEATLGRWVWDGWGVDVRTATRPKPDVVWDGRRFVPRKAYRPAEPMGKARRRG